MKITRYRIISIIHSCLAALPWVQAVRQLQRPDRYALYIYVRNSKRYFVVTIEEEKDE